MTSIVELHGVWMEDVFNWFTNHILASGGDGCGAIVCQNYEQAAEWFLEWVKTIPKNEPLVKWLTEGATKEVTHDTINFHDWNENWIFTNNPDQKFHDGDYVFRIMSPAKTTGLPGKALLPI